MAAETNQPKGNSAETVYLSSTDETAGPLRNLTQRDVINLPTNKELVPSFYVFQKNKLNHIEIKNEENIFRIGRGPNNDIILDDSTISETQVSVIKVGDYCYFMDCGTKDCVSFNGVKKRQAIAKVDSRMIMKIGSSLVIYLGIDGRIYDETDSIVLKRSLINTAPAAGAGSEAEVLLKSEIGEWFSDSAPILVGSHPVCDYKIIGKGFQPFHFIVYFSALGLFIEDLTHGQPGIQINNLRLIGAKPITEDCVIQIDKLKINVYVYGEIKARCHTLFKNVQEKPCLALTYLKDNHPPMVLPRTNEKLTLGRTSEADICIPDPSVSRLHAYILVREKCLLLEDNQSHNKTFVNLKPITKVAAIPGDIIEFGDTPFLLHYE